MKRDTIWHMTFHLRIFDTFDKIGTIGAIGDCYSLRSISLEKRGRKEREREREHIEKDRFSSVKAKGETDEYVSNPVAGS